MWGRLRLAISSAMCPRQKHGRHATFEPGLRNDKLSDWLGKSVKRRLFFAESLPLRQEALLCLEAMGACSCKQEEVI
jgi:hypothetical protein